jgi:hypothetical protein
MVGRIQWINDVLGNNYLGIDVSTFVVETYLEKLRAILGDEREVYTGNQKKRDNGHYHITVINVEEYGRLSEEMGIDNFINSLELIFDYEVDDIKLMGLGKAEKAGNVAYFVVVNSDKLSAIRRRYNLGEHDFHITIGFKHKDVFGVRKNEVLKQGNEFLDKLAKSYFEEGESFDFIKRVSNFDGDEDYEVEPIKIEKSYVTFRNGLNNYFNVSIVDDSFRVTGQWQDSAEKPIISRTLVARKLKQK